jgi:hypothetical protein
MKGDEQRMRAGGCAGYVAKPIRYQTLLNAIDDVLALFEVLKAMDDEREDLGSYVNLFGYNPKYGVSGRRIVGVRYEPQSFSKGLTRPEQTLPARVARR